MPLFEDEDFALKQKLSGFTVTNYANGLPKNVGCFYGAPDFEIQGNRAYPYFMINRLAMEFSEERAQQAYEMFLYYDLEQATPPLGSTLVAQGAPMPWDLIYQISAFAMQPEDDWQLQSILWSLFPQMYGFLDMTAFDGTIRRADLVDSDRQTRMVNFSGATKRVYRSIFTIKVSAESFLFPVATVPQVQTTALTVEFEGNVPLEPS